MSPKRIMFGIGNNRGIEECTTAKHEYVVTVRTSNQHCLKWPGGLSAIPGCIATFKSRPTKRSYRAGTVLVYHKRKPSVCELSFRQWMFHQPFIRVQRRGARGQNVTIFAESLCNTAYFVCGEKNYFTDRQLAKPTPKR